MNCNLRVQAGPKIKGEVTSPSRENREKFAASREKFAASREKCFQKEDTRQKHGYIISSYEPLADFFPYTSISDQKIIKQNKQPNKKKKKNMLQEIFLKTFLTCFILILFLFFKGANSEEY